MVAVAIFCGFLAGAVGFASTVLWVNRHRALSAGGWFVALFLVFIARWILAVGGLP